MEAHHLRIREEALEIVLETWRDGRICHEGKYWTIPPEVLYRGYTLKEITLVPTSECQPVEC